MWDKTRQGIDLELRQLNTLVDHYHSLLEKVAASEPNDMEVAALGAMLHSFYNGVENIFKRIALEIDHAPPSGLSWHSELLEAMARPAAQRPAVFTAALQDRLWDYLEFRHVFRSAYSFILKWDKMAPLVHACAETLQSLEAELRTFMRRLD